MPTTLTLGRDPAADIIIGDPSISRRHAELVLLDDRRIFVRDLGGANGTVRIRAGQRVTVQREIVSPGDEVSFGDVVLSFDALKEMMLERLGRAPAGADVAAGSPAHAQQQGGPAQGAIDARDLRDAAANRDHGANAPPNAERDGGGYGAGGPRVSFGEFVPMMGGGFTRLRERGLLLPALAFAIFVSRLSWLLTQETPEATASFVVEFSLGLVFVAYIVVYRLCGKVKPWLVILGVMAAEAAIMASHPLFDPPFCSATGADAIIWKVKHAGAVPKGPDAPEGDGAGAGPGGGKSGKEAPPAAKSGVKQAQDVEVRVPPGVTLTPGVPIEPPGFFARLWAFFTCAGLREELEKMLPVFGLIFLSNRSTRSDARRWGVFEPLDAIVYACAAATAFIVIETFSSHGYVGSQLEAARAAANLEVASYLVFPLAVLRTIDALTGHLAYSGYFAYFVGLGLMRPKQRERLWLGGWLMAALIHGFFDAVVDKSGTFATTLVTFIALFFLITAILNARKLSPTREENFATRALPRERRA